MSLVVGTNSYISRADAIIYLADALHAESWDAASTESKDRALVTAARMLERQQWVGEQATNVGQTMQWPRTGVSDREGVELPSDTVPQFILDAQCELAVALLDDVSVQSNADTSTNIRRMKAGTAEIEYFVGKSGTRFPTVVHELIGYYLANSSSYIGPFVGGLDAESRLGDFSLDGSL